MGNYWGIQIISGVMNILGALGIVAGVYFCTKSVFGFGIGFGSIIGGIFLVAQAQMLDLAVGLARNVAQITANMRPRA